MKYQLKQINWYICLIFLAFPFWGWGQTSTLSADREERFLLAKKHLMAFMNDSAILVLNELVADLSQTKELDSPFGLRVQFRQAEAFEKDQRDSIGMVKLLHVKDLSFEKKAWDVYANSNLILARLYEKIGLDSSCLVHLRLAESAIKNHVELDSIYPLFCIRISSYHRIFDDIDSSKYFAKEVLRTAPKYKQVEEIGVGHMLLGMLIKEDTDERLEHWKAAAKSFLTVKDYTGYSYMTGSAGGWYLSNGALDKALAYSDTTIAIAKKIKKEGNDEHFVLTNAYHFRSKIYKKMGEIDSAMFYMDKGYRNEIEYNWQENNEKVIAVDARYKDEKKAQKIAEQARELAFEKERKFWWYGLSALVLLLAAAMGYYSLRLRKANEKLTNALEQQMMMQGELHHRVKNNLQVIISLLDLQKEEIEDPQARKSMQGMSNRIYSMAAIHEILYQKEGADMVNFLEYTQNLCQYFSNFLGDNDKPVFDLDIENRSFNLETLMPLGIVLNELLTNSLKYAVQGGKRLQISISTKSKEDGLIIRYCDNGPGFLDGKIQEREGGLGTYLIRSMARQLQGSLVTKNEKGAVTEFFFKEKNG